jgi:DNA-binding CsgD family transcriptional regulator
MRHRAVAIDAAGAVPHAVGAGDAGAVLELAPIAAAQAASLGAHRVAVAHYANARCYATRLSVEARATLNAAYAFECYLIDDVAEAVAVQQEVIALWTSAGDASEEGHAISELAQYLWWNGQTEEARAAVARAIAILEALPAGSNLARAYGRQAQLQMVAGDNAIAIESGRRAVDLAEQLGEEAVVVHALNTIGSAESCMGFESGVSKLEESLRRARAADLEEDIARAFNNLIATSRENRQYELLDRHVIEAIAFAEDHDLNLTLRCLVGDMAEAALERGRWREAAGHADGVLERDQRSGRIQSLIVLGRLAARRGESDPWPLLEEALELLGNEVYGEGHCPVRAARAETAWLAGDVRLAAKEVEAGVAKLDEHTNLWLAGELAFWATKVGLPVVLAGPVAEPYALYLDGHPAKAAAAWATLGCPYEQAQALADSQDQADLREALQIFQSLGAAPAAARVTDRLRALGVSRIARGPRRTTQSNPLGLTDRETEVLRCLADGLRNAEIAARLVISVKTVDHHVSAVLAKLGVRSRYDAGKEAIRLGLKAG